MDLIWIIYLIDVLTGNFFIGVVEFFLVIGILVGAFIKCVMSPHGSDDFDKSVVNIGNALTSKATVIVAVVLFIFLWLSPSKDTAYKMLAAYGVTEAYAAAQSSDKVKAIAGKSLEVLEKAMDDYLTKEEK